MSLFSIRLKELRTESRLTQKEVAEKLEVSCTGYANWEQGHREPALDSLVRLCDFFNVTADYILGRTNEPSSI